MILGAYDAWDLQVSPSGGDRRRLDKSRAWVSWRECARHSYTGTGDVRRNTAHKEVHQGRVCRRIGPPNISPDH